KLPSQYRNLQATQVRITGANSKPMVPFRFVNMQGEPFAVEVTVYICNDLDVGCLLGSDFLLQHTKYIDYEKTGSEKLVFRQAKFGEVAISVKSQANQKSQIDNSHPQTSTLTMIPATHIHVRNAVGL